MKHINIHHIDKMRYPIKVYSQKKNQDVNHDGYICTCINFFIKKIKKKNDFICCSLCRNGMLGYVMI